MVFISVRDRDKPAMVELGRRAAGARLRADRDPRHGRPICRRRGSRSSSINKVFEGRPHIVDRIKDGQIALVLNTTEGQQAIADSYTLRRAALVHKVPYYTTVAGARAVVQAIVDARRATSLQSLRLQSYYSRTQLEPFRPRT